MDNDVEAVYKKLKQVARNKDLITYSEVGELVGLDMATEYGRIRIAQILDEINIYEDGKDRPMLSSVVVLKAERYPGAGYFECARGLGKYSEKDDLTFFAEELGTVYEVWSQIQE